MILRDLIANLQSLEQQHFKVKLEGCCGYCWMNIGEINIIDKIDIISKKKVQIIEICGVEDHPGDYS